MSLRSPDDMTPEQLAQALKNAAVLEHWIAAVKGHAFDVLKAGGKIPGYKLGFGAKRRVWKFAVLEKAIKTLEKMGITHDELFPPPEIISLPKAEKVLKAHGLWPTKKRGDPRPKTPLDPFTDYTMPEPRLMPIDGHEDEPDQKRSDAEQEFG